MSRQFGLQNAGNLVGVPTKAQIVSLIHATIGNRKVELSQDRLAEILLNMITIMNVGSGVTTVDLHYLGNILTVTVNGVSDTVNLNPTTGGTVYQYDAGDDVYVRASALGIVAVKSAGLVTITMPNNVTLHSARVHGTDADLDGSNEFTVDFVNLAGSNTALDLYPPTVQLYDRILGIAPTQPIPYVYNISETPQIQITGVGVKNLKVRVINLNAYLNWGLLLNF